MEEASISVHLVLSIAPNHLKILKRTIVWKSNQTRYSVSNTWPQLGRSWNLMVYWDSEVTSDHVTGTPLTIKSYNNSFMACWGNVCVCVHVQNLASLKFINNWLLKILFKTFLILQRHYAFWDPKDTIPFWRFHTHRSIKEKLDGKFTESFYYFSASNIKGT